MERERWAGITGLCWVDGNALAELCGDPITAEGLQVRIKRHWLNTKEGSGTGIAAGVAGLD